jgi:hypothetical protein
MSREVRVSSSRIREIPAGISREDGKWPPEQPSSVEVDGMIIPCLGCGEEFCQFLERETIRSVQCDSRHRRSVTLRGRWN